MPRASEKPHCEGCGEVYDEEELKLVQKRGHQECPSCCKLGCSKCEPGGFGVDCLECSGD